MISWPTCSFRVSREALSDTHAASVSVVVDGDADGVGDGDGEDVGGLAGAERLMTMLGRGDGAAFDDGFADAVQPLTRQLPMTAMISGSATIAAGAWRRRR